VTAPFDPSGLANLALEREPWARERLAKYAARTFAIRVGPMVSGFCITAEGALVDAPLAGATPDVQLVLSPFNLPAFLADPRRFDELVAVDGDPEFANTLKELAGTLPWFVEQAFARVFGPIVGQRIADAGKRMLALPEYAAARITENVASYARDEVGLIARNHEVRDFAEQTGHLAAATDALAARIAALETHVAGARTGADIRGEVT
jgi:ubiquinone biosynthesis accessory factor UbiJ